MSGFLSKIWAVWAVFPKKPPKPPKPLKPLKSYWKTAQTAHILGGFWAGFRPGLSRVNAYSKMFWQGSTEADGCILVKKTDHFFRIFSWQLAMIEAAQNFWWPECIAISWRRAKSAPNAESLVRKSRLSSKSSQPLRLLRNPNEKSKLDYAGPFKIFKIIWVTRCISWSQSTSFQNFFGHANSVDRWWKNSDFKNLYSAA